MVSGVVKVVAGGDIIGDRACSLVFGHSFAQSFAIADVEARVTTDGLAVAIVSPPAGQCALKPNPCRCSACFTKESGVVSDGTKRMRASASDSPLTAATSCERWSAGVLQQLPFGVGEWAAWSQCGGHLCPSFWVCLGPDGPELRKRGLACVSSSEVAP